MLMYCNKKYYFCLTLAYYVLLQYDKYALVNINLPSAAALI